MCPRDACSAGEAPGVRNAKVLIKLAMTAHDSNALMQTSVFEFVALTWKQEKNRDADENMKAKEAKQKWSMVVQTNRCCFVD